MGNPPCMRNPNAPNPPRPYTKLPTFTNSIAPFTMSQYSRIESSARRAKEQAMQSVIQHSAHPSQNPLCVPVAGDGLACSWALSRVLPDCIACVPFSHSSSTPLSPPKLHLALLRGGLQAPITGQIYLAAKDLVAIGSLSPEDAVPPLAAGSGRLNSYEPNR